MKKISSQIDQVYSTYLNRPIWHKVVTGHRVNIQPVEIKHRMRKYNEIPCNNIWGLIFSAKFLVTLLLVGWRLSLYQYTVQILGLPINVKHEFYIFFTHKYTSVLVQFWVQTLRGCIPEFSRRSRVRYRRFTTPRVARVSLRKQPLMQHLIISGVIL